MTDVIPTQKKVGEGAANSESRSSASIDGSLWVSIAALVGSAIAVVIAREQPEKIELRFEIQRQQLEMKNDQQAKLIQDLKDKVTMLETNVLIYREDVVALEKKVKR